MSLLIIRRICLIRLLGLCMLRMVVKMILLLLVMGCLRV